jgi:hypothetical protein
MTKSKSKSKIEDQSSKIQDQIHRPDTFAQFPARKEVERF